MKKEDLYRIKVGLEDLGEVKNGPFAYRVIKNLKMINEEITLLDELREPSEEYIEKVQTKIQGLIRKYAEVDAEGNAVENVTPEGTSIKVDAKKEQQFLKERDKLLDKEINLQTEYAEKIENFHKALNEDVSIELIMFTEKDIPTEGVSVKQLYQIKELLVD